MTDAPPETISYPVWITQGGMMVRRDSLPREHPECLYNYIRREYGVAPEQYGVFQPPAGEFYPSPQDPMFN
ncbi:hypothetical protein GURKE_00700 [Brevundimonas phage vB_BpoS-Gurke]|uniref:Uncharacterized protein n=1 Tax=Brevundimonas phage vB_BpoS-Gurke TaxID=2948599 RepID=A0A9E7ST90_9CAUD|nr:hypothetical protein GURKE_00700 [Brevundimonas phage vB_BpoS-Gurke]